jgi:hypothetical protein
MALTSFPNSLPAASNETPVKDYFGQQGDQTAIAAGGLNSNPYGKGDGDKRTTPLYVMNMPFTTDGSLFNGTFPAAVKCVTYTFDVNVGVAGVMLTTSVTNPNALLVAIQLGKFNLQTNSTATNSSDIYLTHIFQQNSTAISQNTATSFGEDSTIYFSAGDSMSISISAANDATVLMAGQAQLWFYKI